MTMIVGPRPVQPAHPIRENLKKTRKRTLAKRTKKKVNPHKRVLSNQTGMNVSKSKSESESESEKNVRKKRTSAIAVLI